MSGSLNLNHCNVKCSADNNVILRTVLQWSGCIYTIPKLMNSSDRVSHDGSNNVKITSADDWNGSHAACDM